MLTSRSLPLARSHSSSLALSISFGFFHRTFATRKGKEDSPLQYSGTDIDPRLLRSSKISALPPQAPLQKPSFYKPSRSAKKRREEREKLDARKAREEPPSRGNRSPSSREISGKRSGFADRLSDRLDVENFEPPSRAQRRENLLDEAGFSGRAVDRKKKILMNPARGDTFQRRSSRNVSDEGFPLRETANEFPKHSKQGARNRPRDVFDSPNAKKQTVLEPEKPARGIPQRGLRKGLPSQRGLTQELFDTTQLNIDDIDKTKNPFLEKSKLLKTKKRDPTDPVKVMPREMVDGHIQGPHPKRGQVPSTPLGIKALDQTNIAKTGIPGIKRNQPLERETGEGEEKRIKGQERGAKKKEMKEPKKGKSNILKLATPEGMATLKGKEPLKKIVPRGLLQLASYELQQLEREENPSRELGDPWEKIYRPLARLTMATQSKQILLFQQGQNLTLSSYWRFLKERFIVPNRGTEKTFRLGCVANVEMKWGKGSDNGETLFIFSSPEEQERFPNHKRLFEKGYQVLSGQRLIQLVVQERQKNESFNRIVVDGGSPFSLVFHQPEFKTINEQNRSLLVAHLLSSLDTQNVNALPASTFSFLTEATYYLILRNLSDVAETFKLNQKLSHLLSQLYHTQKLIMEGKEKHVLFVFSSWYDTARYIGWRETEDIPSTYILRITGQTLLTILKKREDLDGVLLNAVTRKVEKKVIKKDDKKLKTKGEEDEEDEEDEERTRKRTQVSYTRYIPRSSFQIPQLENLQVTLPPIEKMEKIENLNKTDKSKGGKRKVETKEKIETMEKVEVVANENTAKL